MKKRELIKIVEKILFDSIDYGDISMSSHELFILCITNFFANGDKDELEDEDLMAQDIHKEIGKYNIKVKEDIKDVEWHNYEYEFLNAIYNVINYCS